MKKALVGVHKENESRVGKDTHRRGVQGNRLQAVKCEVPGARSAG